AATVFTQLSARPSARRRLAQSLAASLTRMRLRLHETLQRYLAADGPRDVAEAPMFSDLGTHVQLLDLARQEGMRAAAHRSLVTLTTATERLETFVGTIDTLSRQSVGRTYRSAVAGQIETLSAALDHALDAFAHAAGQLASDASPSAAAAERSWPDLAAG